MALRARSVESCLVQKGTRGLPALLLDEEQTLQRVRAGDAEVSRHDSGEVQSRIPYERALVLHRARDDPRGPRSLPAFGLVDDRPDEQQTLPGAHAVDQRQQLRVDARAIEVRRAVAPVRDAG